MKKSISAISLIAGTAGISALIINRYRQHRFPERMTAREYPASEVSRLRRMLGKSFDPQDYSKFSLIHIQGIDLFSAEKAVEFLALRQEPPLIFVNVDHIISDEKDITQEQLVQYISFTYFEAVSEIAPDREKTEISLKRNSYSNTVFDLILVLGSTETAVPCRKRPIRAQAADLIESIGRFIRELP